MTVVELASVFGLVRTLPNVVILRSFQVSENNPYRVILSLSKDLDAYPD